MLLFDKCVLDFFPQYRSTQVAWQALEPFAAWLMRTVQPGRTVELGSYRGDSFFTMLQSSQGLEPVREIWAVDSWEGDRHTGPYGDGVYSQFMTEFSRRADPRARHLRMLFSDALAEFEDGSIDLLHIDGAHDYGSVREDYETWLPKMAPDGIILFHDTLVRQEHFGVWRLWADIVEASPEGRTINLGFSNGLGVLCLGEAVGHDIHRLCAAGDRQKLMTTAALEALGTRILRQSQYEYMLMERAGLTVAEDHVFARGEELEFLRQLRAAEREMQPDPAAIIAEAGNACDLRLRDHVAALTKPEDSPQNEAGTAENPLAGLAALFAPRHEFDAFGNDLRARSAAGEAQTARTGEKVEALESRLTALRDDVADIGNRVGISEQGLGALEKTTAQRLDEAVAALRADLAAAEARLAALAAETSASLARDLLGPRAPEMLEAIAPGLPAALENGIPALYPGFEPHVRNTVRLKNDAQDDAIIGIGAKVDAHEQALNYLIEELRKILKHPFFR
ncbi:class I SAM-dependent methyltransferase [Pseudogemmobacter humi]|uniref:Methyltransferase domain protein n=1 Tax=Pseudogemmobacter humi TaxID=2483812 RepID=A0A3P5XS45_9RHOB|nr:class I SAM-dependent methyltransferase [Pseudogemmobacter humi]VDC33192.1 hypothetical protein XINFAN_03694 [Pseudogemmobacter humi]